MIEPSTPRGSKVRFITSDPGYGYTWHKEATEKYLTLGQEYTVDRIERYSWAIVFLQELPEQPFLIGNFEQVSS